MSRSTRLVALTGASAALALAATGLIGASASAVTEPAGLKAAALTPQAYGVSTGTYYSSGRRLDVLKMESYTIFQFVPGTESPGGYSSTYDKPSTYKSRMVAAFNGAFKLAQTDGGYYLRGRTYQTLRTGKASLVITSGGKLNVINWSSSSRASSYRVVRQNFPLLVSGGVNKAGTRNVCTGWGALGGGPCYGERSALGVTAAGKVVYVYGAAVNANDLAKALIANGVTRGMVLEMNKTWPVAYTYSSPGGTAKILPSMHSYNQVPGAFKGSSTYGGAGNKRDFIVAKW